MEFCKVTTKDGFVLQGMLFKSSKKSRRLVIHIHGMAGNFWENGFVQEAAKTYPKEGVDLLTVETRGTEIARWFFKADGKPQLIGNAFELFEDCIYDIDAWVNYAKNYNEIILQAHSLGCSKIVYYQTEKQPKKVKALVCISPADVHGVVSQPDQVKKHEKYLKEAKFMKNTLRGKQLLPHMIFGITVLSAQTYISLLGDNSKAGIFNFYNTDAGFDTISRVDVPVLLIMGTEDKALTTNPQRALELLKEKAINAPRVEGVIYEGAKHNYRGFEKKIASDVLDFIKGLKFIKEDALPKQYDASMGKGKASLE